MHARVALAIRQFASGDNKFILAIRDHWSIAKMANEICFIPNTVFELFTENCISFAFCWHLVVRIYYPVLFVKSSSYGRWLEWNARRKSLVTNARDFVCIMWMLRKSTCQLVKSQSAASYIGKSRGSVTSTKWMLEMNAEQPTWFTYNPIKSKANWVHPPQFIYNI